MAGLPPTFPLSHNTGSLLMAPPLHIPVNRCMPYHTSFDCHAVRRGLPDVGYKHGDELLEAAKASLIFEQVELDLLAATIRTHPRDRHEVATLLQQSQLLANAEQDLAQLCCPDTRSEAVAQLQEQIPLCYKLQHYRKKLQEFEAQQGQ